MAGHKLLPAFLDMITLFGALFGSIGAAMLLALFARNDGFKMFYRRGNGSKHMRAVVFGCFLSGLSALPYLFFSLQNQSQICPFQTLHILGGIRVFSLRFESTQLLFLALDRLIIAIENTSSKCRQWRRRIFWPCQVIALVLASFDLLVYSWKENSWPSYSLECTLLSVSVKPAGLNTPYSVSNPIFMHWHFFLLNFLTFSLTAALLLAQHLCKPGYMTSSQNKRRMARLANVILTGFCFALGIVVLLELADRFTFDFDANKQLRNYADTALQLLHVAYMPMFLRFVPWKLNAKVQAVSSISALDLGISHST